MNLSQFTALARPIDPRYKSNRAIAIMAASLLCIGTVYQFFLGNDMPESMVWGLKLSVAAFFAWMLAREIDPDRLASSFLAIPFAVAAFVYFPYISILLLFGMVLMLRMISQVTGRHALWIESIAILGLGTYLAWHESHLYGFAISAAFLLDSRLPSPHLRHFWFGCAALLIALIVIILSIEPGAGNGLSIGWIVLVAVNCLLFMLVIRHYKHPQSKKDYSAQPLNRKRIQTAQMLALATMLAHLLYQGHQGLFGTAAFWSAILAANLVQLYRMMAKP